MGLSGGGSPRTQVDFASVFDRVSLPVYVLNSRRRLVYANPAFWELSGLTPDHTRDRVFEAGATVEVDERRVWGFGPPWDKLPAARYVVTPWPEMKSHCPIFPIEIIFVPLAGTGGEELLTLCLARQRQVSRVQSDEAATCLWGLTGVLQGAGEDEYFVAASAVSRQLLDRLTVAARAPAECPLLITGEAGSGKTRTARMFHTIAVGRGPYVRVDAAAHAPRAVLEHLFPKESEERSDPGLWKLAEGGTLVIENVEYVSPETLEKLRLYQTKKGHCRLVFTTRLTAEELRAAFGDELTAWITTIHIPVAPLRDRRDDIVPLALYFAEQVRRSGGRVSAIAADACQRLLSYDWPGNAGQLRDVIEAACHRAAGPELKDADLPGDIKGAVGDPYPVQQQPLLRLNLEQFLRETEKRMILLALSLHDNNKAAAAEALGLSRAALYRRMVQLGLAQEE